MRRIVLPALFLTLCFIASYASADMTPWEAKKAHQMEMKKIKETQRAAREEAKKNPVPQGQANGFWAKEGERSGLGDSGHGIGQFVRNLNPMPFFKEQQEKYNQRKTTNTGK